MSRMNVRRAGLWMVGCLSAGCARSAVTPSEPAAGSAPATSRGPAATPPAEASARAAAPPPAPAPSAPPFVIEPFALPGASGPLSLDFIILEPERARVWVPAGGTGSVDVFELATHAFTRIEGFKTAQHEAHGTQRVVGPSAGAIGEGFAYIGNRASEEVCAVDVNTLRLGSCLKLQAAPDDVEYVALTHEVWVTTPSVQSIVVLAALPKGALKPKSIIKLEGEPECTAVDPARSLFLTNLEDKNRTLSIDLKSHAVKDNWAAGCGDDGPRGVAVDSARGVVLVACTDHVHSLDMAHGGAPLATLDTGAGLDNIDYVPSTGLVYAAAGKAERLTVARLGEHGSLTMVTTTTTAPGVRNAVAAPNGDVYAADARAGRLLRLRAAQP